MTPGGLRPICREALDADTPDIALRAAERLPLTTPTTTAVRAAIEAAASADEDRWHEALRSAADHGLRLIAVDALEGLAVAAASSDSLVECLRLVGAAARLREETGYRWRSPPISSPVRRCPGDSATRLSGEQAERTHGGGTQPRLEPTPPSYARRARGERKRLATAGPAYPNRAPSDRARRRGPHQPADRRALSTGRATVKTHLEHVFTKLGVQSRAELAGEVIRRTGAR